MRAGKSVAGKVVGAVLGIKACGMYSCIASRGLSLCLGRNDRIRSQGWVRETARVLLLQRTSLLWVALKNLLQGI